MSDIRLTEEQRQAVENRGGSLLVSAIQFNDYNVVLAVVFVYSIMFISVMLIVDILYGVIDPRIRLAKEDAST